MSQRPDRSLSPESFDLLKDLVQLPGLPGHESDVRDHLREAWQPLLDDIQVSPLGNLVGLRKGEDAEAPTLLLTAHMDAIGLIVSAVEGSLLRVEGLGSIDARVLAGRRVRVLSDEPLPGYVTTRPRSTLPDKRKAELDQLIVDVGLDADDLDARVQVGDLVAFEQAYENLAGGRFFGRALDNRISLVALTEALHQLEDDRLEINLLIAATTLEETSHAGGMTLATEHKPDAAVIVDTGFGRATGLPQHKTFPLGDGVTVGRGPSLHPGLERWMQEVADDADVPWSVEVLPRRSGTDADWIQLTGRGVPCGLISIPILNMHTCVEVADSADVHACTALLAGLAKSASATQLEGLGWD